MKKLNIVQIFYARPHLGGSGIMSMEAAKELAKRGHNVHIVSYPGTFLTEEEKEIGLKIHPVERIDYPCFKAEPYNATLASQTANLFFNEGIDIDIIHANYGITHGEAAITAKNIIKKKGGHTRTVITSHGSDIHTNGHHELLGLTIEDTLESADAITFVSRALQEEARKLFNLNDYGSVIYNFVDEERFKPCDKETKNKRREEIGVPLDAIVVYHASNFRPVKKTELIVDAAKELRERENIYFLMVGDGPQKADLEEKAKMEYNLGNKIIFIGKQEDVLPYIHASDMSILTSERESFGLALLEAMSCELPALGSDVGGIPEVISHEKSGYVFENGNVDQMVHYIQKLAEDSDLRLRMGLAAKKMAVTEFSRKKGVDSYEQLYHSLVC